MRKILVVLAILCAPIAARADLAIGGSITSTTCAGTGCVALALGSGQSTCSFTLGGTWVATIVFQGQVNGAWRTLTATALNTGVQGTSATANGDYQVQCAGLLRVQAVATGYTSGTVNVSIIGSTGVQASLPGTGATNVVTTPSGTSTAVQKAVVSVSASAGGTAVAAANATRATLYIENESAVTVFCNLGATVDASTNYFRVLSASGSGPDGLGGWMSIGGPKVWTGVVQCISSSGTASVGVAEY